LGGEAGVGEQLGAAGLVQGRRQAVRHPHRLGRRLPWLEDEEQGGRRRRGEGDGPQEGLAEPPGEQRQLGEAAVRYHRFGLAGMGGDPEREGLARSPPESTLGAYLDAARGRGAGFQHQMGGCGHELQKQIGIFGHHVDRQRPVALIGDREAMFAAPPPP
jgi:hypothetical protein